MALLKLEMGYEEWHLLKLFCLLLFIILCAIASLVLNACMRSMGGEAVNVELTNPAWPCSCGGSY